MKSNQSNNLDSQKTITSAKKKIAILGLVNLFVLIIIQYPSLSVESILFMVVQFALMYVGIFTYVWRVLFSIRAILTAILSIFLIISLFAGVDNTIKEIINLLSYAIVIISAIMLYKDSDISYYLKYKWLIKK